MLVDHHPSGIARIRPPDWCLARLRAVTAATLCTHDERPRRRSVAVGCVAEGKDLVFVVREQVEQTWFLVWSEVTIEVTGRLEDGQHWVVRIRGTCEREPLPPWAGVARRPPFGGPEAPATPPPFALRIREAGACGYSVLMEERAAG